MELRVPGDKSISQRGLILASLAAGTSRIRGLLPGGDTASTARALRQLGSRIPPLDPSGAEVRIPGLGLRGLRGPSGPLDLENSGTGARLLLGVLSGQPLEAIVTGDESLRRRPMARVTDPLAAMGARFENLGEPDRLPIRVKGGRLRSFSYPLPVASAQLKSALLLAGLVGGVDVKLLEPGRSRDHTERMLNGLGIQVVSGETEGGWSVVLSGVSERIPALDLDIPGDFSSASFFILYGLLKGGGEPLILRDVGLNPTRTGLLPVLARMEGVLSAEPRSDLGEGEPSGELTVFPSELKGVSLGQDEVPGLIDEVPILAVGAARAQGVSRITGAGELRVKETDRIRAVVENLRAIGVEAEELEDGMEIQGTRRPLKGRIKSYGDHRIAMAFGVLGALPENQIEIDGKAVADVSFPGFWELLDTVAVESE
ncbi:MAG: 3-phosphoshikimate 1-carboxyvinyltransferase [Gemmatimonadota bacterium]|jgi:3-phosphoshikimate 1-carboxyvinyltransferase